MAAGSNPKNDFYIFKWLGKGKEKRKTTSKGEYFLDPWKLLRELKFEMPIKFYRFVAAPAGVTRIVRRCFC